MTMRAINRLKIIDLTKDKELFTHKENRVLRVIFDVSRNEIPFRENPCEKQKNETWIGNYFPIMNERGNNGMRDCLVFVHCWQRQCAVVFPFFEDNS